MQRAGDQVGSRDHRLTAQGVEKRAQQQRAAKVSNGNDREEVSGLVRRHSEKRRQNGREAEGYGVVEKRLPDEQREAEGGSPRVPRENRLGDGDEADGLALPHGDLFVHLVKLGVRPVPDGLLDVVDQPFAGLLATVDEQPPWAFRHATTNQQDTQTEHDAESESETPANGRREDVFVQCWDRQERAERGA